MNTGQMLLTIGAIFLLALVILRVNTNLLVTDNVLDRSKVDLLAVSLITSTIEEATGKSFDNVTANGSVTNVGSLTDPANLGIEAGEVYPQFNDFDDYNDFRTDPKLDTIQVSGAQMFIFETFCAVDYVTDAAPETISGVKTWNKRLSVKVTSEAMTDANTGKQDTLRMSSVFSYWFF